MARVQQTEEEKAIDRLYRIAKLEAEKAVGGPYAFRFLGPDIRRAVVSKEVLNIVYCQDDLITGETLKKLVDGLVGKLTEDQDFYR
jgi:hypothetical protein